MAILQGARITGSIIATQFIKASGFSGSLTASRLYVQGSVGIGTSTPGQKLHLYNGNLYIQGTQGFNAAVNYTSFSRLIFNNDYSNTTNRGPNKITLYDDGSSWYGGFGIHDDIIGYYSGGNHVWYKTTGQTTSNEYMRLNSSGNLGIGTSSPSTMLQVVGTGVGSVGTINIKGSQAHLGFTTAGGTFKGWTGYFNSATHGSDLDLNIKTGYAGASNIRIGSTGDTTQVFISGSGNVGIGTTSPVAKLEPYGTGWTSNAAGSGLLRLNGTDNYPTITFAQSSTPKWSMYVGGAGSWIGNGNIGIVSHFGTEDATRVKLTVISGSGNVGIGTTSPGAKLQVSSSASTLAASFQGNVGVGNLAGYYYGLCSLTKQTSGLNLNIMYASLSSGYGEILMSNYNDNTGASGWASYIRSYSNPSSDYSSILTFGTCAASTGAPVERMRITATGNVGIGTTGPLYRLQLGNLTSTSTATPEILSLGGTFSNSAGSNVKLRVYDDTGSAVGGMSVSSGQMEVNTWSSGKIAFYRGTTQSAIIDANGNVGIGTSSPGAKLVILGETQISSNSAYTTHLNYNDAGTNFITTANTGYTYFRGSSNGVTTMAVYGGGGVSVGTSTLESGCILTVQASNSARMSVTDGTTRAHFWPTGGAFYISTETNSPMVFITNAGERMRILANGNVGIGTSSPLNKLSVISSNSTSYYNRTDPVATFQGVSPSTVLISVDGNVNGYYAELKLGNAQSTYYPYSAYIRGIQGSGIDYYRLEFGTAAGSAATTRMTIANDGNVGIGTTAPAAKLDVVSGSIRAASGAYAGEINFGTAAGDNTNIYLKRDNNYDLSLVQNAASGNALYLAGAGNVYVSIDSNNNETDRAFIVQNNSVKSGTELFRVNESGNVGIGTTSPIAMVHIESSNSQGDNKGLIYLKSTSGTNVLKIGVDGTNNFSELRAYNPGVGDNSKLIFQPYGGNVGIGTTNPTYKLEVAGTLKTTSTITNDGGIYYGGGSNLDINQYNNGYMRFLTNNNEKMRIAADGNVGIGSSSPTVKFDLYNGRMRYYDGTFSQIPNVVSYKLDNNGTGGYAIKTPFLIGTSYEMAIVHVLGYVYGNSTLVDFKVVFYDYGPSNAPINYSMVDNGNDGFVKYLAKDSSGYINICFAGLGSTYYYARFTVNLYTTRYASGDYSAGWTFTQTTSANYGMSTLYDITPVLTTTTSAVGIGTYSPISKLDIRGSHTGGYGIINVVSTDTSILCLDSTGTRDQALRLKYNGSDKWLVGMRDTNESFSFSNGSDTRLVTILQNGCVGIGTTVPATKLEVYGVVRITESASGGILQIQAGSSALDFASTFYGGTYRPFTFTNGGSERMRIEAGGNVGIGTSSPTATLTVIATNNTGSRIQLGTATTSTYMDANKVNDFVVLTAPFGASPASVSNGGAKWGIKMNGSIDSINIKGKSACVYAVSEENSAGYNRMVGLALHTSGFDLDNAERVRIKNDGNVGIGTTSPTQKLDINGTLRIRTVSSASDANFLTIDASGNVNYRTGGANGTSGTSGANGSPGSPGSSGTTGVSGTSGVNGTSGTSGANGSPGSSGATGTSGSSGSSVGGSPVRAYVYFNGTGTVTINGSNNVTSITDNGVGDYTVNFTTAFVDAYYAVSGTCTLDFTNASSLYNVGLFVPRQANAQVAGSCRLACEYYNNTLYDCVAVRAMFVRA
jgi:hypothetical protein